MLCSVVKCNHTKTTDKLNINQINIARMKHVLHKISLFTAATIFTLASYAQSYEYEGVNYILDHEKKTASVTYLGNSPEENSYSGEIEIYTKIEYNDTEYRVTSIGEKAFYGCDDIVYVNIGGLIQEIGSEAFANNKMGSLIIPEDVTTIAADAFKGSSINLFMLGTFEDYSFLNSLNAGTPVYTHEEMMETVKEAWSGEVKNLDIPLYVEDLSTMTTVAFRLHRGEFYSLPNSLYFEFSSVNTRGVEIFPDADGVYSWDGLTPGTSQLFIINYNIDGDDLNHTVTLTTVQPKIECKEAVTTATTFTATIVADEERAFTPSERGIVIKGQKYKADENNRVEISDLTEETAYTAKSYAVYKNKTYYGEEFTFETGSSTGITNTTAGNEPKVTLVNNTRNGSLEISASCEGDATYSIINITGQKEKDGAIQGENKLNSISTAELSSGIYLINVNGNKLNKTLKFIIK